MRHFFAALFIRLRYRISVHGLAAIKKSRRKDCRPILFLPNHQALIDPAIVISLLHRSFAPRPLADEQQMAQPWLGQQLLQLDAVVMPDLAANGSKAGEQVFAGLEELVASLKRGKNVLLYPSGRLSRGHLELIGGNSGAANVIRAVPETRIVLVRIRGLWGSRFSRAQGNPSLQQGLGRMVWAIFVNGIFFMPRRKVRLEFVEPDDFPRRADKTAINRCLEEFYNRHPDRRTEVPLYWWRGCRPQYREDILPEFADADTSKIPAATRSAVLAKLQQLTGAEGIAEHDSLAADLGMDSIALAELGLWLRQKFNVTGETLAGLKIVSDCILAAGGIIPTIAGAELKPVSAAWFVRTKEKPLTVPAGASLAELLLRQAKKNPDHVILTDQISGDTTWRQLLKAVFALLPEIEQLPGQRIGIMMPPSVSAAIAWLTVLFSGKEAVLLDWMGGNINMHALGVQYAITLKALAGKPAEQEGKLEQIGAYWLCFEELIANIGLGRKLSALLKSRYSWRQLRQANLAENAAILFPSGPSEQPAAVPLAHAEVLANLRDLAQMLSLSSHDRLLGFLPLFHPLGLTGTMLLPLCTGLRAVYWPNSYEGAMLARMTAAYGATVLLAAPASLQEMLRSAKPEQLHSLRLVCSASERCPEHVVAALREKCPQAAVLCEGNGRKPLLLDSIAS